LSDAGGQKAVYLADLCNGKTKYYFCDRTANITPK